MSVILRFTTRRQFGKYNHIFSFSSAYVCMFYELPCLSVHVNFSTVPEICLTSNVLHGYWWVSLWCHLRALGQTEPLRLLHSLVRWSLYCSYVLCVLVHQGSPCIPSIIRVSKQSLDFLYIWQLFSIAPCLGSLLHSGGVYTCSFIGFGAICGGFHASLLGILEMEPIFQENFV